MKHRPLAIHWFRQDLRLHDNTALLHAQAEGFDILPLFILDDAAAGDWSRGGASRWWLHESLQSLNLSLEGKLVFRKGPALEVLKGLIAETGAQAVFWNRCYEPWRIARDKAIKDEVQAAGLTAKSFKDSLLWEPWEIYKSDNTPYRVFTPFYRKGCLQAAEPPAPAQSQKPFTLYDYAHKGKIDDLGLMPDIPWYQEMQATWRPGESGARDRFNSFLQAGLKGYKTERNRPDFENVSRLSPHLHFGEISIRSVWHEARAYGIAHRLEADMDHFCSELGWREFSYSLLYYNPEMTRQPLQAKFKVFPWTAPDPDLLRRWQKGRTGIPIIDAGMRQLWQTGWMHNRVRMIVASFLVKNLLIHWHHGEDWFWDTLVDADLANNSASWQWVAGCGADAAPYFRIFNPVTQGQKFDPEGTYVRRFVPELKDVPASHIHTPWEAPQLILAQAGIKLGHDYPLPIVDLKQSRDGALKAFEEMKVAG